MPLHAGLTSGTVRSQFDSQLVRAHCDKAVAWLGAPLHRLLRHHDLHRHHPHHRHSACKLQFSFWVDIQFLISLISLACCLPKLYWLTFLISLSS